MRTDKIGAHKTSPASRGKRRGPSEATKDDIGTGSKVTMSPTGHMGLDLSAFRMLEIRKGDWTLID